MNRLTQLIVLPHYPGRQDPYLR